MARALPAALLGAVLALSTLPAGTAQAAPARIPLVQASAAPSPAPDSGNVGVAPGSFDPKDPRTRAYFIRSVAPGQRFTDTVRITNSSRSPVKLLIDPVDGLTAQTTGSVFADRGPAPQKAGGWVTVASRTLTVPPGGEERVQFTLTVPPGTTPGDHLAGISVLNTATTERSAGALTVTTQVRSVVGVLVQVPGPAVPELDITGATIEKLEGLNVPAVNVVVNAPGRKLVKPRILVRLSRPGYEKVVERPLDTILPGAAITYPQSWPEALEEGEYAIHIELSAPGMRTEIWDSTQRLGGTIALPSPTSTTQPPPGPPEREDSGAGPPLWAIILGSVLATLVLLALGWFLLLLWKRRRDDEDDAPPSAQPPAASPSAGIQSASWPPLPAGEAPLPGPTPPVIPLPLTIPRPPTSPPPAQP